MFTYRSQVYIQTEVFLEKMLTMLSLGDVPTAHPIKQLTQNYLDTLLDMLSMLNTEEFTEYKNNGFARFSSKFLAIVARMVRAGEISADLEEAVRGEFVMFSQLQKQLFEKRKKIVILTASVGFGHNSAANALRSSLYELYGYDVDICVIDILKGTNMLYETSVKYTPGVYKWFFDSTDTNQSTEVINALAQPVLSARIDQILAEEQPDLLVSTYPLLAAMKWVHSKLHKTHKVIPLVAVVTDSVTVHQMWVMKHVDHYIVPNEDTKKALVQKGVDVEKICVFGFPVNPSFYLAYDAQKERAREGLKEDILTFLVLVNTGAKAKDIEFLEYFEETFQGRAQCMLVLGKNEQLYKKIAGKDFGTHVKIYRWVGDMYRLMQSADVVVSKAGGATTMECIAIKKPMIITKVLPGQEEGNAETVIKYGVGTVLERGDAEELISEMKRYHDEPELLEMQKKNFAQITIPKATYKSAEFLWKLL